MKGLDVQIRRAVPADVRRIVEIERSWDHLSHWSEESYQRLISEDRYSAGHVAEVPTGAGIRSVAGFVIFHVSFETAEIYNIAVEKSFARSGVGTQLMLASLNEAARRDARAVHLEVRKSNAVAIAFYVKFGFRTIGERPNYYSNPVEDAFVMERLVGPSPGRSTTS